jgi:hypothetical protein
MFCSEYQTMHIQKYINRKLHIMFIGDGLILPAIFLMVLEYKFKQYFDLFQIYQNLCPMYLYVFKHTHIHRGYARSTAMLHVGAHTCGP